MSARADRRPALSSRAAVEREPEEASRDPVNVLWMTSGLGCDGDSIAMTAATNPSLEDLLRGCFPGMPPVVLHNSLLAYDSGDDFMGPWNEAAEGKLEPFILVLEGSVPNEEINGEGCWASFGLDPLSRDPIPTTSWIDRLAPRAAAVLAIGTCAAYGGIPAMRNNPTGAMGLRDYLGVQWRSRLGLPLVNLPGCPVQPDNITETLLCMVLHLAGIGPAIALDEQGRPQRIFGRTAHESCDRAGLAEHGKFSKTHGDGRCLVKLGCKGPAARCNVPIRGWVGGIGGCPNVGGICIACTMPSFPDRYMPFVDPQAATRVYTTVGRYGHGAVMRFLRDQRMRRSFEVEPAWRRPSERLETGYRRSW